MNNEQENANGNGSVRKALRNRARVQEAMREAVQNAVRTHKLLGHPIIIWKDGKVVEVPPEEIVLEEPREARG